MGGVMSSDSNSSPSSDMVHNEQPVGEDATQDAIQVDLTQTNILRIGPQGSTVEGRTTENVPRQNGSGPTNIRTMTILGPARIYLQGEIHIVPRDKPMKKTIEMFIKVNGLAVGTGTIITSSSFTSSWGTFLVMFAHLLGLIYMLASRHYLSVNREALAIGMFKIGAIATWSAVTLSGGLQLPWPVGPIACLIAFLVVTAAVAYAPCTCFVQTLWARLVDLWD